MLLDTEGDLIIERSNSNTGGSELQIGTVTTKIQMIQSMLTGYYMSVDYILLNGMCRGSKVRSWRRRWCRRWRRFRKMAGSIFFFLVELSEHSLGTDYLYYYDFYVFVYSRRLRLLPAYSSFTFDSILMNIHCLYL